MAEPDELDEVARRLTAERFTPLPKPTNTQQMQQRRRRALARATRDKPAKPQEDANDDR